MHQRSLTIVDIGGEGRHASAWNVNPRMHRTGGARRGEPIPRLIRARGDQLPLADRSVDLFFVERTPLRLGVLEEIKRVAKPTARIILRHALSPITDPHRLAIEVLGGRVSRSIGRIGRTPVHQTVVMLSRESL
jgi:ubiquinone/menaquinone biosynthesis C-methylase UbiE